MITALIILICIITVLLILIVLIQNSKGGGLTGEFGGLGSNQLMGVKKTTDLLEQITWGLGIAMMVLSLATYVLVDRNQAGRYQQRQRRPGTNPNAPRCCGSRPCYGCSPQSGCARCGYSGRFYVGPDAPEVTDFQLFGNEKATLQKVAFSLSVFSIFQATACASNWRAMGRSVS